MTSAPSVQAQGANCDIANSRQIQSVGGGAVIYLGGPVFTCTDGTRILADSAVYVQSIRRIDFMGNVRFNEARRSLTSQYAQYLGSERRLMAQVNVVLTDKENGTTLRAATLNYMQETATRRQAVIEALTGRPHAVIIRRPKVLDPSARRTATSDTTIVDADRLNITGQDNFQAWGNVDVKRGAIVSNSGYAEFRQDTAAGYMKLTTNAVLRTDTFTLRADTIVANTTQGNDFRDLHARVNAQLESSDVDVNAPVLDVKFTEGKVSRFIALGGKRANNGPQAKAVSPDFSLTADSIDAVTPSQKLENVTAVGMALGERRADTADVNVPKLIARDWVRGDTVRAFFVDAPPPATGTRPDSAAERVVERISAVGQPASSTYRLRDSKGDTTEVSVNYITARSLDVIMKAGVIDKVNASGDIRGVYLQPPRRTAQVPK